MTRTYLAGPISGDAPPIGRSDILAICPKIMEKIELPMSITVGGVAMAAIAPESVFLAETETENNRVLAQWRYPEDLPLSALAPDSVSSVNRSLQKQIAGHLGLPVKSVRGL